MKLILVFTLLLSGVAFADDLFNVDFELHKYGVEDTRINDRVLNLIRPVFEKKLVKGQYSMCLDVASVGPRGESLWLINVADINKSKKCMNQIQKLIKKNAYEDILGCEIDAREFLTGSRKNTRLMTAQEASIIQSDLKELAKNASKDDQYIFQANLMCQKLDDSGKVTGVDIYDIKGAVGKKDRMSLEIDSSN